MKFMRWIVGIWLLLLVLVGAVKSNEQGKENALSILDLGVCEGKPCYRGIVPGVTRWDDVRTHLDGAKISVNELRTIAVTLTDKIEVEIYRDEANLSVVGIVRISDYSIVDMMPTDFPSLGHFLLMYGPPCLVIVDTSNPTRIHVTQLTYPTLTVSLYSTEPFSPSARVRAAWIFNTAPDLCTIEFNKSIGVSWTGFAKQQTYLQALMDKPVVHFP